MTTTTNPPTITRDVPVCPEWCEVSTTDHFDEVSPRGQGSTPLVDLTEAAHRGVSVNGVRVTDGDGGHVVILRARVTSYSDEDGRPLPPFIGLQVHEGVISGAAELSPDELLREVDRLQAHLDRLRDLAELCRRLGAEDGAR